MKLVIFVPCLNEEQTLPTVLRSIPKKIAGIDEIEILVVDDGCTDGTVAVARRNGVKHFVHHRRNMGLSTSFKDGLNRALQLGADIIVLTDGDNQYPQERIPELIRPIQDGWADTVIADRQIETIDHFTPTKKFLQHFGTKVLNMAAGTTIPDATSGFRAYSRSAAMQLNVIARYSFATETVIQAAHKQQAIAIIPIKTNPKTRESRQFKSSWQHVRKSSITIIRAFIMHQPYVVFLTIGVVLLIGGLIPFVHYLILYFTTKNPNGPHHLQSLIIGAVLLVASFIAFTLGVIADLVRINRLLLEDILEHLKQARFNTSN
ncbi:MAG TPA: glycosyltransferase family 2 protein [Candidatus Saccharimonadales bacterium]|nr:glycosyltransferase family 2 protein [Candidatus Saccharimonadales bacterium]